MAEFTPGPWDTATTAAAAITGRTTEPIYGGFVRRLRIVKREEGECGQMLWTIAEMDWNNSREADARLIAAAPEMYEALRNIENDDGHMPETIWKMVQDALAKAEGRRE